MRPTLRSFGVRFSAEHREIRDALLELARALGDGDMAEARSLVRITAEARGPHFRYTEVCLYPRLVPVLGQQHINRLIAYHHDAVIDTQALADLASLDALNGWDRSYAVDMVRGILNLISTCDGLSLVIETLPEADVRPVLAARDTAYGHKVDMFSWAATWLTMPTIGPHGGGARASASVPGRVAGTP